MQFADDFDKRRDPTGAPVALWQMGQMLGEGATRRQAESSIRVHSI
jgi:hypothetical protein